MGRVIAVANQKGGVGKTTTAVNLSTSLAKKGKKVILIDGDPQGNATSGLGVEKDLDNSIYDVLVEEVDIKTTLQDTCVKTLKVCPSNMDLAGAEVELVSQMSREFRLKEKIDPIKDEFDYIIIDCPPSLGLITLNSFTAADSVLIPVQCEYYALEGLGQRSIVFVVSVFDCFHQLGVFPVAKLHNRHKLILPFCIPFGLRQNHHISIVTDMFKKLNWY